MPEEFVNTFGHTIPFMVGLSCKHVLWCVDCDLKRNEIRSLNRFKRYYGLKIFNLVQLDYVGDGLFIIRLFKETAFESKYPTGRANDVEWSKDWETLNRAQYVIDSSTLECEKAMALISFNACANRTEYAYLIFVESKFDEGRGNMVNTHRLCLVRSQQQSYYFHPVWNSENVMCK